MLKIKVVRLFCIDIYDLAYKTYIYECIRHFFYIVLINERLIYKICD